MSRLTAIQRFIAEHTATLEPLQRALALAHWEAATTGSAEASAQAARLEIALRQLYADPTAYAQVRAWYEADAAADDPLTARQLTLLYLEYTGGQQDPATIEALTALEKEVRDEYTTYRARLHGRPVSDNTLDQILAHETDSTRLQEAWEASKQIGQRVADRVRELARRRNAAARRQGFRDHFQKSLLLAEIAEDRLFALLATLEAETAAPFRAVKEALDARLAARFGVTPADLRPWHYGDRFFQNPPPASTLDLDPLFAERDLVALAVRTFDGLGFDVRPVLARSDLYARPGKNQHAFCTDIDRRGDVRILCNLEPTARWLETLLHELGHAVYDRAIDPDLPYLLRTPAHLITTEAVALLLGRLVLQPDWLTAVAGVDRSWVAAQSAALAAQERLSRLIFLRWALVVVHFERALYADPDQDLNRRWWDLVERFQLVRRPEGRDAPDWAAKIHLALHPVYYQNYLLGELLASQLAAVLRQRVGRLVDAPAVGAYLTAALFRPGARADWETTVCQATGQPLTPLYLVQECCALSSA